MASSPPTSPSSASNSESSATHTHFSPVIPSEPKVDDDATENVLPAVLEDKLHLEHFRAEKMEKYKNYEAEYAHRLMEKYFSKKNFYGGNIFDDKMIIDEETIMSSRWPFTRSFADPLKGFEEQSNVGSKSET